MTLSINNFTYNPYDYQSSRLSTSFLSRLVNTPIDKFCNLFISKQQGISKKYDSFNMDLKNRKKEIKKGLFNIAIAVSLLAITVLIYPSILIGIGLGMIKPISITLYKSFPLLKRIFLKSSEAPSSSKNPSKSESLQEATNFVSKPIVKFNKINYSILPVMEELIFRVGIQQTIKNAFILLFPSYITFAAKIAIISSGIIFGLAHLSQSKTQALFAGISGILIEGPLMEKYGFHTCVAAHITNNLTVQLSTSLMAYYSYNSLEKEVSRILAE